jgi:tripartite-type tricarboxylate transporter receptor subunit TctC
MSIVRSFLAAAAVAAVFGALTAPVQAADDPFKGKQIHIIIGNSPGGGFDDHGRLLAQFLGKFIPGNPTIIPQNMPGAATLKSIQYVALQAPQDGTAIALFNPNLIVESLTDAKKIETDFTKMNFLGSATGDVRVCFTWYTTGIKTFEDALKADQIIMGATSQSSNNYANAAILKNVFGVKIKQVLGYPGSTEQYLATERGELSGGCGSWTSIPANWIAEKKVVPFVRFSEATLPGMPPLPYILDKARNQEERQLLNLILSPSEFGRPYVMGPGVPPATVKILQDAFDQMVKDKDFLAAASKIGIEITGPTSGPRIQQVVKELYATPASVLPRIASAVQ